MKTKTVLDTASTILPIGTAIVTGIVVYTIAKQHHTTTSEATHALQARALDEKSILC